jgi:hypothetical protein
MNAPGKTTAGHPPARPARSLVLAIAAIGLAIFGAAVIFATGPRFRELLAEFELPLSILTLFVLGPVLPSLLALIATATLAKEFIPGLAPIANVWNGIVLCVAIGCLALYVAGLLIPLMSLLNALA